MAHLLTSGAELLQIVRGSRRQFLHLLLQVDESLGRQFCGSEMPLIIIFYLASYCYGGMKNCYSKMIGVNFSIVVSDYWSEISAVWVVLQKNKARNSLNV